MTIRHLKIFLAVFETGSTTAASKKLLIAQPSVSVAISELETHYGIRLFERYAKRLCVTEEGKHFYQYVRHVVDLFDEMEDNIHDLTTAKKIRIGASITVGNYMLPQYIKKFAKTHPKVIMSAIIENTSTIENLILENKIDVGLVEGKIRSQYIISQPYMEDHLVMVCSLAHPYAKYKAVVPEVLAAEKFILREKGSAVREIFEGLMQEKGIPIEHLWESASTQAIINAVSENLGVSVLPYMFVKNSLERKEVAVVKIDGLTLCPEFSIVYHQNKYLDSILSDFIELCKTYGGQNHAPDNVSGLNG